MPWGATSDVQRFEQAVEWFVARAVFTREEWDDLADSVKARSFMVSGVAQLDIVTEVHESLSVAVRDGIDFGEWRKTIGAKLKSEWVGTVGNPGHRLDTIYRNALQSSYNAGRYEQRTRPAVMVARPYWVFDAVIDSTTSPICRSLNGVTRRAGDPWFETHTPPLHHQCRSTIRSVSRAEGERRIREGRAEVPVDASEPDESWGRVPTRPAWEPRPEDYPAPLWNAYERVRSRPGDPLPARVRDALDEAAD